MNIVKKLPKSVKKNIRREKERIRRSDFSREEKQERVNKLYDFWKKRKINISKLKGNNKK